MVNMIVRFEVFHSHLHCTTWLLTLTNTIAYHNQHDPLPWSTWLSTMVNKIVRFEIFNDHLHWTTWSLTITNTIVYHGQDNRLKYIIRVFKFENDIIMEDRYKNLRIIVYFSLETFNQIKQKIDQTIISRILMNNPFGQFHNIKMAKILTKFLKFLIRK